MTVETFLTRFDRKTAAGGQWLVRCPAHQDQKASLAVRRGEDGRVMLHCHAGCDTARILDVMGLTAADLFETKLDQRSSKVIEKMYPYCDEGDTVLYEAVRYTPKDFRQRRPDGNGGWWWNLPPDVRRVPYRLPELMKKPACLVVEGEKDADALWAIGIPATCNIGGAGKWRDDYARTLKASGIQRVVVSPDNDDAGRAHMETVARSCDAVGLTVRCLTLPGLPLKGDISDYLTTHTKADLLALIKTAPLFDPATTPLQWPSGVGLVLVNLADVTPEHISWLWPGRLARKKVAIIAGDPGVGKSFVTLDIAARVTTGRAWPDGQTTHAPGHVIFLRRRTASRIPCVLGWTRWAVTPHAATSCKPFA